MGRGRRALGQVRLRELAAQRGTRLGRAAGRQRRDHGDRRRDRRQRRQQVCDRLGVAGAAQDAVDPRRGDAGEEGDRSSVTTTSCPACAVACVRTLRPGTNPCAAGCAGIRPAWGRAPSAGPGVGAARAPRAAAGRGRAGEPAVAVQLQRAVGGAAGVAPGVGEPEQVVEVLAEQGRQGMDVVQRGHRPRTPGHPRGCRAEPDGAQRPAALTGCTNRRPVPGSAATSRASSAGRRPGAGGRRRPRTARAASATGGPGCGRGRRPPAGRAPGGSTPAAAAVARSARPRPGRSRGTPGRGRPRAGRAESPGCQAGGAVGAGDLSCRAGAELRGAQSGACGAVACVMCLPGAAPGTPAAARTRRTHGAGVLARPHRHGRTLRAGHSLKPVSAAGISTSICAFCSRPE